jgi:hypothetical protein
MTLGRTNPRQGTETLSRRRCRLRGSRVLDLPQVIISAGRPGAGLALAPASMVTAMAAQVADLCEDE